MIPKPSFSFYHITETNAFIPTVTVEINTIYKIITKIQSYVMSIFAVISKYLVIPTTTHIDLFIKYLLTKSLAIRSLTVKFHSWREKLLGHPFTVSIVIISVCFFILMIYDKFEYYWDRHEKIEHRIRCLETEMETLKKKNKIQENKIKFLLYSK